MDWEDATKHFSVCGEKGETDGLGRRDPAEAGTPDELLEYCDGECDQCPYGKRIPADRGWSKAEFFKEDSWMCTLKGED